jgi:hypothetical protein
LRRVVSIPRFIPASPRLRMARRSAT